MYNDIISKFNLMDDLLLRFNYFERNYLLDNQYNILARLIIDIKLLKITKYLS